eukprot:TRINITY_DN9034_c0_g1_i1.p1 TRINITY_DN9034_c0_g1~~TRINITY_DN9034_c0_g1_i1.p1  ORF type:complete len:118 (+),score=15.85 TRINITY_DN9034_c0_g1_i1:83-436(+)
MNEWHKQIRGPSLNYPDLGSALTFELHHPEQEIEDQLQKSIDENLRSSDLDAGTTQDQRDAWLSSIITMIKFPKKQPNADLHQFVLRVRKDGFVKHRLAYEFDNIYTLYLGDGVRHQ